MSIRIAITDDHPTVRNGLKAMLQSQPGMEVTAMYANGNTLLAGLQRELPDVLLLDIHLPDIPGNELVSKISAAYPTVAILILTSIDSAFLIKSLVHAGVKGYLLKTSDQDLLIQAIQAACQGTVFLPPDVQSILAGSALNLKSGATRMSMELTEKEREILCLISEEFTSQEIADKMHLSVRTIDNYRLGLMQKLDVKNLAGLVKKGMLLGIIK
jgi:DNA-binding NarL/FixJ family response regulator